MINLTPQLINTSLTTPEFKTSVKIHEVNFGLDPSQKRGVSTQKRTFFAHWVKKSKIKI